MQITPALNSAIATTSNITSKPYHDPADKSFMSDERRILILSDTHMGHPKAAVWGPKALRNLWQRARATDLIINGDIAELHHPKFRASAAKQVVDLQNLCQDDGVKITLLSGNHDPHLTDQRHLSLNQGEVFMTHGDIIHPAISPWNNYAKHLQEIRDHAYQSLSDQHENAFQAQSKSAQHASHLKWNEIASDGETIQFSRIGKFEKRFSEAFKVMWYWHRIPRMAADFAAKYVPESRFFIFGHIHRAGIWESHGRIIINTGSFDFPKQPRAVVIKRNQLSVWKLKRQNMIYDFAAEPLRKWDLNNIQISKVGDGLHAA
ncbi:phosphodiesterase [Poriferisphaera corsica]|uniref:Phosphodiesterase n=1 Tax=Poriferisphaera corsica TaxID=2528020 RepID=A0A517YRX9_9BACT|nr:metallophosphoesterase [Poriferisphaera corsica]QDU32971.1 phosphodiesterase [Poriferisphaera corsica]